MSLLIHICEYFIWQSSFRVKDDDKDHITLHIKVGIAYKGQFNSFVCYHLVYQYRPFDAVYCILYYPYIFIVGHTNNISSLTNY